MYRSQRMHRSTSRHPYSDYWYRLDSCNDCKMSIVKRYTTWYPDSFHYSLRVMKRSNTNTTCKYWTMTMAMTMYNRYTYTWMNTTRRLSNIARNYTGLPI